MTTITNTPNQAAHSGTPAKAAADGGRAGDGLGGEAAYAQMPSTPNPDGSVKERLRAPGSGNDGDSMWPVILLVMAMIGTAAVASSRVLKEQPTEPPKMAQLFSGAGAAVPTDRADAAARLTVRSAGAELRSAPSSGAEVIGGLQRGQTVLVVTVADEWTGVRVPSSGGAFGWVRSSVLSHE